MSRDSLAARASVAVRRGFFHWLFPAALVLPAWMMIGWLVSNASGWMIFWVFISMPCVFIAQLALAMLVRSRPSVRLGRAVSWLDVGVIGAWQALTVFVALIVQPVWGLSVLAAVIAFVAAVVVSVRELWAEARGAVREQVRMTRAYADPALFPDRQQPDSEVIVLHEVREGR